MPLVNPENLTNTIELIQWMNTVSDQKLGPAILITFGLTTFLTLKVYDTERAFAASSFVIGIIGVLLAGVGILNTPWTISCVVLALIGIIMLVWKD